MILKFPTLGKRPKAQQKEDCSAPLTDMRNKKARNLTGGDYSNDIALDPIIRVSTTHVPVPVLLVVLWRFVARAERFGSK